MDTLTPTDINILKHINHYDCLTIAQVQRIFGWKSYPDTSARLSRLAKLKVLDRKSMAALTAGAGTLLYKVGKEGKRILTREGITVPRFDMGHGVWVSSHYRHTTLVNDFFITAHLWARTDPTITIAHELHELDIKRSKDFPYNGVIPDGWIDIHVGSERYCFLLEVETGSHAPAAVKEKVEKLISFAGNGYQQVFGTDILVYLFLALEDDDHRKSILKTMAITLREQEMTEYASLFKVTSVQPSDMSLFTQSVWYTPGDYSPHQLLD